jgi:Tfp pilus assembly protein PilN
VTKTAARVLLLAFGLVFFASPAFAKAAPAQGATQTNGSKKKNVYLNKMNKQQKKQQKQMKKHLTKAHKNFKNQHPEAK